MRKLASISQVNISKAAKIAEEAFHFSIIKIISKPRYCTSNYWGSNGASYYENVATCFYQLNTMVTMLYSSKVISNFNPRTGKLYLHGISKISTGDLQGGCEFITKAIELNSLEAQKIKNQFCKS